MVEKEIAYIYSYIQYHYFSVEEFKDSEFLLDISERIQGSHPELRFSDGKVNSVIDIAVFDEMAVRGSKSFQNHQRFKEYIFSLALSEAPSDSLLIEVMRYISSHPDEFSKDITKGEYDSKILDLIHSDLKYSFVPLEEVNNDVLRFSYFAVKDGVLTEYKDEVYAYVYNYLKRNSAIFETTVELSYVVSLISADICRDNVNRRDLVDGMCDEVIDAYMRTNKDGIKLKNDFLLMLARVKEYVENSNYYMDIEDKNRIVIEEAFKLSRDLYIGGHTIDDIRTGKCDDIMNQHIAVDSIKANSVTTTVRFNNKTKCNPNKLFLRAKELLESKRLKAAGVIAILGLLGLGLIHNSVENTKAEEAYNNFTTSDYQAAEPMSNAYVNNLQNILNDHNKYMEYGPQYGQICLYKAYEAMQSHEFNAMDAMCSMLRERSRYSPENAKLYEELSVHPSYLDYVYYKLVEADSSNVVYAYAVSSYNAQVANYRQLEPTIVLTKKDKDSMDMLDKMMKEYGKYISKLEVEMGKAIKEEGGKSATK